jgi:hypothetical protein
LDFIAASVSLKGAASTRDVGNNTYRRQAADASGMREQVEMSSNIFQFGSLAVCLSANLVKMLDCIVRLEVGRWEKHYAVSKHFIKKRGEKCYLRASKRLRMMRLAELNVRDK